MKRRKQSNIIKFLLICIFAISAYLLFGVAKDIMKMNELAKKNKELESQLSLIEEENTSLLNQKAKLSDPNYVQTFARGNYMFSKQGEQVFYLPSSINKANENEIDISEIEVDSLEKAKENSTKNNQTNSDTSQSENKTEEKEANKNNSDEE